MNKLLEELLKQGFKAKARDGKIVIILSSIALPIFIVHDIALNKYVVKMGYWRTAILVLAFSINALISFQNDDLIISSILAVIAFFYPISMLITQSKAKHLRQYIDSINGESEGSKA